MEEKGDSSDFELDEDGCQCQANCWSESSTACWAAGILTTSIPQPYVDFTIPTGESLQWRVVVWRKNAVQTSGVRGQNRQKRNNNLMLKH